MANEKSPQRQKLSASDAKLVADFWAIVRKAPKSKKGNKFVIANTSLGKEVSEIAGKIRLLQPSTKAKGTDSQKQDVRNKIEKFNDTYKPFLKR